MADLSLSVRNFNGENGLESLIYVKGDDITKDDIKRFAKFCSDYAESCKKDVRLHLDIGRANSPAATCLIQLREMCRQKNLDLHVTYPAGKRNNYDTFYLVGINAVVDIAEKDYELLPVKTP